MSPARKDERIWDEQAVERPSSCVSCSLRSGCLPRDLEEGDLEAYSAIARLKREIRRSSALFRAGDCATAIYIVRSGTFKTMTVCECGKQDVAGFHLPGDIMGLEALDGGVQRCDAIALEDSEVCVIPVRDLQRLTSAVPALNRQLVRVLSREISRGRGLSGMLSCMDAEHRVTRLLLNLAERYHRLGYADDALLLRMTRDEIADHLGLSSETVSRVISRMRRKGLLTVNQRHIGLIDPAKLSQTLRHRGGDRSLPDAPPLRRARPPPDHDASE